MSEPPDLEARIAALEAERHRLYVGRTVLVPIDPGDNYGQDVAIGVVTKVLSPTTINCYIIRHGPYQPFWLEELSYVSSLDGLPENQRLKRWTWTGGM